MSFIEGYFTHRNKYDVLKPLAHPTSQHKRHIDRPFCSAIFAGLKYYCHRPTDKPRYWVCNNRPRLRKYYCDAA